MAQRVTSPLWVAHLFAVFPKLPLKFLVEQGISNAVNVLTRECDLPKAEVYEWIAKTLGNLQYIQVPEIHQARRVQRRMPTEVRFFSNNSSGLVHFVDFGAAGYVTHLTAYDEVPKRMVVGSISSHPEA